MKKDNNLVLEYSSYSFVLKVIFTSLCLILVIPMFNSFKESIIEVIRFGLSYYLFYEHLINIIIMLSIILTFIFVFVIFFNQKLYVYKDKIILDKFFFKRKLYFAEIKGFSRGLIHNSASFRSSNNNYDSFFYYKIIPINKSKKKIKIFPPEMFILLNKSKSKEYEKLAKFIEENFKDLDKGKHA